MGVYRHKDLPTNRTPYLIDNVVDTGNTAKTAIRALGCGTVASFAMSDTLGRVSKTLNPCEKYNFTFWSSNVKYQTTANLRLDFSDKTVLELMKEKTYTGKEFAEFIKKK